jgi:hypothetical protein
MDGSDAQQAHASALLRVPPVVRTGTVGREGAEDMQ